LLVTRHSMWLVVSVRQLTRLTKEESKPPISTAFTSLKVFMEHSKVAAADFTAALEREGILLWQLPTLTVADLRSCGLPLGAAGRVRAVASGFSAD
jgi:hypothetical protein